MKTKLFCIILFVTSLITVTAFPEHVTAQKSNKKPTITQQAEKSYSIHYYPASQQAENGEIKNRMTIEFRCEPYGPAREKKNFFSVTIEFAQNFKAFGIQMIAFNQPTGEILIGQQIGLHTITKIKNKVRTDTIPEEQQELENIVNLAGGFAQEMIDQFKNEGEKTTSYEKTILELLYKRKFPEPWYNVRH